MTSQRLWRATTQSESRKSSLWRVAVANSTTLFGSYCNSVAVGWPSARPWCRQDTQQDVWRLPQCRWLVCWCTPVYHWRTGAGWVHDMTRANSTECSATLVSRCDEAKCSHFYRMPVPHRQCPGSRPYCPLQFTIIRIRCNYWSPPLRIGY